MTACPYLLDTNVLIALAWPNHVHHSDTVAWFKAKAMTAFRTCPITQTGFIRISSNPSFKPNAPLPANAIDVLQRFTALPGHQFWADDIQAVEAFAEATPIATHRQVTDAYLLSLAIRHDGVLATWDRGIVPLSGRNRDRVELLA
jgi:toxin-antitoxin system PIN domain toxin